MAEFPELPHTSQSGGLTFPVCKSNSSAAIGEEPELVPKKVASSSMVRNYVVFVMSDKDKTSYHC